MRKEGRHQVLSVFDQLLIRSALKRMPRWVIRIAPLPDDLPLTGRSIQ